MRPTLRRALPTLFVLCILAFAPAAFADSVTLTPAADNTLFESTTGATSDGAGATMFVGRTNQVSNFRRRGLVRFDVAAAVPAGSTIQSVTLTLFNSQAASPADQTIELHAVLASWGEGASNAGISGGTGAPSQPGDATWKHRFFSGTLWTALGGDFAPAATATLPVGAEGSYTWATSPALVAAVQGWLDAPATNFGWLLLGNEAVAATTKRFDTRESADPATRPALTITYEAPATAALGTTWGRIKGLYR